MELWRRPQSGQGEVSRMPESDLLKARNLVMALVNLTENSIIELESESPTEGSLSSAEQASVVNPNPLELETLLDKVLSYLPVNSLLNARLVNKTWNSFAVDWIRNKRKSCVAVQYAEFPRLCSDFEKCEVLPFSYMELKSPGPGENLEKVSPFFIQHGRFVEGLKLNNTSINLDGRKGLGTIFKSVPNLKKLFIEGINPDDGYGPGIPFYESDQNIQLRQVKDLEFFVSDPPLHKVFLDQLFALIPNLKTVSLDLLAPSQDFELVAEAMKNLHLTVLHDPFHCRLSSSAQFWKLIAGSQKLKELSALELKSRPSHDLVLVEAQEELLRSQSESLEILRLYNQTTPANNNDRAILEFPIMKNLRRLELYFNSSPTEIPLMVPLQPNQVPRLRSLTTGAFLDAVSALLAPTPFTSVEEVELFDGVWEWSNSDMLPEMVSRFPNLKKLIGLTILEAQDMAQLVSCFPDIEELELYVFNLSGHERPSKDFSAFFSGISLDRKSTLCDLAGRVGIDSVVSWIETPGPSLRDLKRLRKLKIVFNNENRPDSNFQIDELGVHLTLLHLSPTLHLTLRGDVSISTKLASKLMVHFQNIYFRQREESDDLPGGDVYFRPVQMKSE